jgi:hypothetical protein
MSNDVRGMLDAIKEGDGLAGRGLLDHLEERGDERLDRVKEAWLRKLHEFREEVAILWGEDGPRLLYPDWRDAIIPAMDAMTALGRYKRWRRCPFLHRGEVDSLGWRISIVLIKMGCSRPVSISGLMNCPTSRDVYSFRGREWSCVKSPRSITFQTPGDPPPQGMSTRDFNQATLLVRYVISEGEQRAERRKAARKRRA